MALTTSTRIIIGASAYASVRYSINDGEDIHCGTIDFLLPGGRGASADLVSIAEDNRQKAKRYLRLARIADAAAIELAASTGALRAVA